MIQYLVPAPQAHVMLEYLGHWGRDLADRLQVLPYEELPDRRRFEPGTYILSGLDQLGPEMTRLVSDLHRDLARAPGFRLLNQPGVTLGRFELLTELHRRGLVGYRIVRAAGDLDALRYPVFLRAERTHDGAVSPLLGSKREVEAAIGRALLRGRRLEDLLVVEFSDTTSPDGLYRRYMAFLVGDRVVPRGLAVGRDWMLKERRSIRTEAAAEEELEYVSANPHSAELAEIRAVAGVGYGRIDYTIRHGRVEAWEINLNPRIGNPPRLSPRVYPAAVSEIRNRTKQLFYRSFPVALKAIETRGGRDARPAIDEAIREAARGDAGIRRPSPEGGLARFLEPVRPVLETVAGGFLPWIGRLARRRPRPLSGR